MNSTWSATTTCSTWISRDGGRANRGYRRPAPSAALPGLHQRPAGWRAAPSSVSPPTSERILKRSMTPYGKAHTWAAIATPDLLCFPHGLVLRAGAARKKARRCTTAYRRRAVEPGTLPRRGLVYSHPVQAAEIFLRQHARELGVDAYRLASGRGSLRRGRSAGDFCRAGRGASAAADGNPGRGHRSAAMPGLQTSKKPNRWCGSIGWGTKIEADTAAYGKTPQE